MAQNVYVKSSIWAGEKSWYVGLTPSFPNAGPCDKLGSWYAKLERPESAFAIARSHARKLGGEVIECPCFVGLE
jgi:hypothetical protein